MLGSLPPFTDKQIIDNLENTIKIKDEQLLYKDNIIQNYKVLVELLRKELINT